MKRISGWGMAGALIFVATTVVPQHGAAQTVLRHVPQADVKVLDPVANTATNTMQYSYLVYDQLFAFDEGFQARPQMVEAFSLSPDQRAYEFALRPGLRFHDGTPVTSKDVIASIKRWSQRDPTGTRMNELGMTLEAVDDRRFRLTLREAWGQVIDSMSKPGWALFIMRESDAQKAINDPVTETVGSGPFRFVRSEWVPGSKMVFEKNKDYVPRAEAANYYSGGKVVKVDRVEWTIIPDSNTAVSALAASEVDAVENVPVDLIGRLSSNRSVTVAIHNKGGLQGQLRPNHLHPPFNHPKAREALLYAVNQEDIMQAVAGNKDYWRTCFAWLICGGPNASEAGTEGFRKQDVAKARQLLKESGYNGEKVVFMRPTGINMIPDIAEVVIQELKEAGFNIDVQIMDWSVLLQRRLKTDPPADGGWNLYATVTPWIDLANPITNYALQAPCAKTGWPGWACSPELEKARDMWAREADPVKRKAIAEQIQLESVKLVPIALLGQFTTPTAYRSTLKGYMPTPIPVMWNVEK